MQVNEIPKDKNMTNMWKKMIVNISAIVQQKKNFAKKKQNLKSIEKNIETIIN